MIKKLWFLSGGFWVLAITATVLGMDGHDISEFHRVFLTCAGVTSAAALFGQVMTGQVMPRTLAVERIWDLGLEAGAREERARLRANPVVVPLRRHCAVDCECRTVQPDTASGLN